MRKLEIGREKYTQVYATDGKGAGNANHKYQIAATIYPEGEPQPILGEINFQNGPIKENGVNGVMNEDLLAVVVDRLDGFQAGPYACEDNEEARQHILSALECLGRRTKAREARGVEGTSTI